MFQLQLIVLIIAITVGNATFVAQVNNLSKFPIIQITVPEMMINITNVTLLAREERYPPDGVPSQPNRDIGFASVFLRLENPEAENVTILIKKIEIRNVSDHHLQEFSYEPEAILLRPLENSEVVFHLTNKMGYNQVEEVKAIVTYQVGSHRSVIESNPVTVER